MHAPPETLRAALAGRDEVERELGQGGMATVYLARDLKHHRLVAIKLVRPEEDRGEADWLRRSKVYARDAYDGPFLAEDRARILAQAGDADEALDEIERLLSQPSWLSVHTLRLDPRWDPIRSHPRFQALLKQYGS